MVATIGLVVFLVGIIIFLGWVDNGPPNRAIAGLLIMAVGVAIAFSPIVTGVW